MAQSTRTQIYLTREQRKKLDIRGQREDKTLAQLIREAVDRYLESEVGDPDEVLDATFGALPNLKVPNRDEWDRGYG
jgi:predicted DNA-binding protein